MNSIAGWLHIREPHLIKPHQLPSGSISAARASAVPPRRSGNKADPTKPAWGHDRGRHCRDSVTKAVASLTSAPAIDREAAGMEEEDAVSERHRAARCFHKNRKWDQEEKVLMHKN